VRSVRTALNKTSYPKRQLYKGNDIIIIKPYAIPITTENNWSSSSENILTSGQERNQQKKRKRRNGQGLLPRDQKT
jgi:hypothetical protein